jgi:hypothetical protein
LTLNEGRERKKNSSTKSTKYEKKIDEKKVFPSNKIIHFSRSRRKFFYFSPFFLSIIMLVVCPRFRANINEVNEHDGVATHPMTLMEFII